MLKYPGIRIARLLDVKSVVRFLCFFAGLYGLDLLWIAITSPGGKLYSPFLQNYLNYPEWIKNAVLFIANAACHAIGVESVWSGKSAIDLPSGGGIYMGYSCYGLETMDLWMAFLIADNTKSASKAWWGVAGVAGIFLINVLRITLLILSIQYGWSFFHVIDHHTFFNLLAYTLILLMVWWYYMARKKPSPHHMKR